MADALDETVLPDMERGPARDQVMAAIGIVRRCATGFDAYGPILHAECVDLVASLRAIIGSDADLVPNRAAVDETLAAADAVLDDDYPSVPDLVAAVLGLHTVVTEVAITAERQQPAARPRGSGHSCSG